MILVLVPLGGHFLKFFGRPSPYDFPVKTSKIIRTGDFSPIGIFGGTQHWYFNSFPANYAKLRKITLKYVKLCSETFDKPRG